MRRSALLLVAASLGVLSISAGKSRLEHTMAYDLEQRARGGNLEAQRELADCLIKSCQGLPSNRALACAWRIVIVAGGMPGVTAADVDNRRLACDSLAPNEQSQAAAQAQSIFQQIHGRELVLPADFFGGPARAK